MSVDQAKANFHGREMLAGPKGPGQVSGYDFFLWSRVQQPIAAIVVEEQAQYLRSLQTGLGESAESPDFNREV